MLVTDASALVRAIADDGPGGEQARARLHGEQLHAPELVDLEVMSALRRLLAAGRLDARRAALALEGLADLPLARASHRRLLPRVWELRDNVTPYDAAYVALAEALDAELLTADVRLASAPGLRCSVSVLG